MDITMSGEVTKAETPNRETTHAGRNTLPKALSCAIFIAILAVCYYHSNKLVKELAKLEARVDALSKAVGDGGGGDGHDPNIMLVKKLAKVEDRMDALSKALKDSGDGHDCNDMLSKKLVELEERIDAVSKALIETDQKLVNVLEEMTKVKLKLPEKCQMGAITKLVTSDDKSIGRYDPNMRHYDGVRREREERSHTISFDPPFGSPPRVLLPSHPAGEASDITTTSAKITVSFFATRTMTHATQRVSRPDIDVSWIACPK